MRRSFTIDCISLHPCNLSQSRGAKGREEGGKGWEGGEREGRIEVEREGGREDSRNKEWIFHRGVSITPLFVSHVLVLRHKQVCGTHSLLHE